MKPETKEWAKDFANRLEAVVDEWNSACGEAGACARASELQRKLIEFVMTRVVVLEATLDAMEGVEDLALDAFMAKVEEIQDDEPEHKPEPAVEEQV